jgi:hypothetical protein
VVGSRRALRPDAKKQVGIISREKHHTAAVQKIQQDRAMDARFADAKDRESSKIQESLLRHKE